MGVLLDTAPLPDLLIKHLGLSAGQGVRIMNVHRDSPADKAGLERDDIIISFQGQDVIDRERFVDEVRESGTGTQVSLAIIHLGQRQTVKLKLEPFTDALDLKYPAEPERVQSWRPGKVFRLRPGDKDWMEILRDGTPGGFDVNIRQFFDEMTTYHHSNGESYTITVTGNPDDDDLTVIVRAGGAEYKTTAREIDRLPEQYREPAKQAIQSHRKASRTRKSDDREDSPFWRRPSNWRSYFDPSLRAGRSRRTTPPAPPSGPDDQILDKVQEQMRQLQQRLDELEKRPGSNG
jgi:hypothetical protein